MALRVGTFHFQPANDGPALLREKGGGGTSDGMDAWQQSVETRLSGLAQDVRDLRASVDKVSDRVDNRFFWLLGTFGAGFLILAGMLITGYLKLADAIAAVSK